MCVSKPFLPQINSNGDRGVLVGSWTKYPNGKEPWLWRDSAEILHEWNKSGPVRYGQCWVFAAVACTGTGMDSWLWRHYEMFLFPTQKAHFNSGTLVVCSVSCFRYPMPCSDQLPVSS